SLEPSHQDSSNDGLQSMFLWEKIREIIPELFQLPLLMSFRQQGFSDCSIWETNQWRKLTSADHFQINILCREERIPHKY
ncbi:MAG: hypothetical protein AB2693_31445, partial [Candidatus Thiodiazotropha sp.]